MVIAAKEAQLEWQEARLRSLHLQLEATREDRREAEEAFQAVALEVDLLRHQAADDAEETAALRHLTVYHDAR